MNDMNQVCEMRFISFSYHFLTQKSGRGVICFPKKTVSRFFVIWDITQKLLKILLKPKLIEIGPTQKKKVKLNIFF